MKYDQLLVERYEAKQRKDFKEADRLREWAERTHKQTIVDTIKESEQGGHHYQYYQDMPLHRWLKKYASRPALIEAVKRNNSIYKTPIKARYYQS